MTQHEIPTHFGPIEIGLRQPTKVELAVVETYRHESSHTQDEALRGVDFTSHLGLVTAKVVEKPALLTDKPHEEYGFTD